MSIMLLIIGFFNMSKVCTFYNIYCAVYRVTSYTWPCVSGTLENLTCPVYATVQ